MKKLLVLLSAVLLLSSVCFAQEAPVAAPSAQEKLTENKKQDSNKYAKPKIKKSGKKVKKADESVKK